MAKKKGGGGGHTAGGGIDTSANPLSPILPLPPLEDVNVEIKIDPRLLEQEVGIALDKATPVPPEEPPPVEEKPEPEEELSPNPTPPPVSYFPWRYSTLLPWQEKELLDYYNGVSANFWQKPWNVGILRELIDTAPEGSVLPAWLDKDRVEEIYQMYSEMNGGKDFLEWNTYDPSDPRYMALSVEPLPPPDYDVYEEGMTSNQLVYSMADKLYGYSGLAVPPVYAQLNYKPAEGGQPASIDFQFGSVDENFWLNPHQVAALYHVVNSLPEGSALPEWLDVRFLEDVYETYKSKNPGVPWYAWEPLERGSPEAQVLSQVPNPPDDQIDWLFGRSTNPDDILQTLYGTMLDQWNSQLQMYPQPTQTQVVAGVEAGYLPEWQLYGAQATGGGFWTNVINGVPLALATTVVTGGNPIVGLGTAFGYAWLMDVINKPEVFNDWVLRAAKTASTIGKIVPFWMVPDNFKSEWATYTTMQESGLLTWENVEAFRQKMGNLLSYMAIPSQKAEQLIGYYSTKKMADFYDDVMWLGRQMGMITPEQAAQYPNIYRKLVTPQARIPTLGEAFQWAQDDMNMMAAEFQGADALSGLTAQIVPRALHYYLKGQKEAITTTTAWEGSQLWYESLAPTEFGRHLGNLPAYIQRINEQIKAVPKAAMWVPPGGAMAMPEAIWTPKDLETLQKEVERQREEVPIAEVNEVHQLGLPKPVKVDNIYIPEWGVEMPMVGFGLLLALDNQLRQAHGEEDVLSALDGYRRMYGFSGAATDLLAQSVLDPLEWAGDTGRVTLGTIGEITGYKPLISAAHAASAERGGAIGILRELPEHIMEWKGYEDMNVVERVLTKATDTPIDLIDLDGKKVATAEKGSWAPVVPGKYSGRYSLWQLIPGKLGKIMQHWGDMSPQMKANITLSNFTTRVMTLIDSIPTADVKSLPLIIEKWAGHKIGEIQAMSRAFEMGFDKMAYATFQPLAQHMMKAIKIDWNIWEGAQHIREFAHITSDLLGEAGGGATRIFEALLDKKDVGINKIMAEIQQKLAAMAPDEPMRLMYEALGYNTDAIASMRKMLKNNWWVMSPEAYRAHFTSRIIEQTAAWNQRFYGYRGSNARVAGRYMHQILKDTMNGALLTLSPSYLIGNFATNTIRRSFEGSYGFESLDHIRAKIVEEGFMPLEIAMGGQKSGDLYFDPVTNELKPSFKIAPEAYADAVIAAFQKAEQLMYTSKGGGIFKNIRGLTKKIANFELETVMPKGFLREGTKKALDIVIPGRLARVDEMLESATTYYHIYFKTVDRLYRVGGIIPEFHMTEELAKGMGRDYVQRLHTLVESTRSGTRLDDAIREGLPPDVRFLKPEFQRQFNDMDGYVWDMLEQEGIIDTINQRLAEGVDAPTAFRSVSDSIVDLLQKRFQEDRQYIASYISDKIRNEGSLSVLMDTVDLFAVHDEGSLRHFNEWHRAYAIADFLRDNGKYEEARSIVSATAHRQNAFYQRQNGVALEIMAGIADSMHPSSQHKAGLLKILKRQQQGWRDFYSLESRLMDEYYKIPWDDKALRDAKWKEISATLREEYKTRAALEIKNYEALAKSYKKLFVGQFGQEMVAPVTELWGNIIERIKERQSVMMDWRDYLDGAETSELKNSKVIDFIERENAQKPGEELTRYQRRNQWSQFVKEVYIHETAEMVRVWNKGIVDIFMRLDESTPVEGGRTRAPAGFDWDEYADRMDVQAAKYESDIEAYRARLDEIDDPAHKASVERIITATEKLATNLRRKAELARAGDLQDNMLAQEVQLGLWDTPEQRRNKLRAAKGKEYAPMWYSKLRVAMAEIDPNFEFAVDVHPDGTKGHDKFMKMLQKKGGYNKDEFKWTGLQIYLDNLADTNTPVTVRQIEKWLARSYVQLEDIWQGAPIVSPELRELRSAVRERYVFLGEKLSQIRQGIGLIGQDEAHIALGAQQRPEHIQAMLDIQLEMHDLEKRLAPGGDLAKPDIPAGKFDSYTLSGMASNYRELLLHFPFDHPEGWSFVYPVHWDHHKNVVVFARMTDRMDEQGRKVLFLEELQADWVTHEHRYGQRVSYKDLDQSIKDKMDADQSAAMQSYEGILDKLVMDIAKRRGEEADYETWRADGYRYVGDYGERSEFIQVRDAEQAMYDAERVQRNARNGYPPGTDPHKAVPDLPYRDTYFTKILQRLLRFAAEEGYEGIAWTTGELQVKRWEQMTMMCSGIWYAKNPDGKYWVLIQQPQHIGKGDRIPWQNGVYNHYDMGQKVGVDESIIVRVFGKDILEMIQANEGDPMTMKPYTITDVDQEVTGNFLRMPNREHRQINAKGLAGQYDTRIKNTIKKFVKQWGVDVEEANFMFSRKPAHLRDAYRKALQDQNEIFGQIRILEKEMNEKYAETMKERRAAGDYVNVLDVMSDEDKAVWTGLYDAADRVDANYRSAEVDLQAADNVFEPVPYVPITDAMRETALYEGFPAYPSAAGTDPASAPLPVFIEDTPSVLDMETRKRAPEAIPQRILDKIARGERPLTREENTWYRRYWEQTAPNALKVRDQLVSTFHFTDALVETQMRMWEAAAKLWADQSGKYFDDYFVDVLEQVKWGGSKLSGVYNSFLDGIGVYKRLKAGEADPLGIESLKIRQDLVGKRYRRRERLADRITPPGRKRPQRLTKWLIGAALGEETLSTLREHPNKAWQFGIPKDDYSDGARDHIAHGIAEEVLFALEEAESGDNPGNNWYGEDYQNAINMAAIEFPELAMSRWHRNVFTFMVAITADRADAGSQMNTVFKMYAKYMNDVKRGKAPKFEKYAVNFMQEANLKGNLILMDQILDALPADVDVFDWLTETVPYEQLKTEAADMLGIYLSPSKLGFDPETMRMPDGSDPVFPRAMLISPKLGTFFANLMGLGDYTTMDIWFTRMFNRQRGMVIKDPTPGIVLAYSKLMGWIPQDATESVIDRRLMEMATYYAGADEQNYRRRPGYPYITNDGKMQHSSYWSEKEILLGNRESYYDNLPNGAEQMEKDRAATYGKTVAEVVAAHVDRYLEDIKKKNGITLDENERFTVVEKMLGQMDVAAGDIVSDELFNMLEIRARREKTGNTIWKDAAIELTEQPADHMDRTFMQNTVSRALELIKEKDPRMADMTPAQLQAVMWYFEKRVYGLAGYGRGVDTFDYLDSVISYINSKYGSSIVRQDRNNWQKLYAEDPGETWRKTQHENRFGYDKAMQTWSYYDLRGSISPGYPMSAPATIRAFQSADAMTMLHETGHLFMRTLNALDMDTVAHWTGTRTIDAVTGDWFFNKAAHEKFAEGFVDYVRTGKYKGKLEPEIEAIYDKFADWLVAHYKFVPIESVHEMTPEVVNLFDRLISAKAQDEYALRYGGDPTTEPNAFGMFLPGLQDSLGLTPDLDSLRVADAFGAHVQPAMDALAEEYFKNPPVMNNGLDFQNLPPTVKTGVTRYIEQVKAAQIQAKNLANNHAKFITKQAMLNYAHKYNKDNYYSYVMPYIYWFMHSGVSLGLKVLDRPRILADMARIVDFMQSNEDDNVPDRLRGRMRFPMPWMEDWTGGAVYVDVLNKLFPAMQYMRPFESIMYNLRDKRYGALDVLRQWGYDGTYPESVVAQARATQSGEVWDAALRQSTAESEEGVLDVMSMFMPPALYMTIPWRLLHGQSYSESPFPASRWLQGLASVTGADWLRKLDFEGQLRQSQRWSEMGDYTNYYIDKQIAYTGVVDNQIPVRDGILAMINHEGEQYDAALNRARIEYALRQPFLLPIYALKQKASPPAIVEAMLLGIMPAGLLPPGELEARGLRQQYSDAWELQKAGDPEAINRFYEEHPEYDAYKQLHTEDPEKRMQMFLVGEIWDRYFSVPELYKITMLNELRDNKYWQMFLDKDYDHIPLERLQEFSATLGGYTPPGVSPLSLQFPSEKAIDKYQEYRNYQNDHFPLMWKLNQIVFAKSDEEIAEAYDTNPLLREYSDWHRDYIVDNPDMIEYITDPRTEFFGLPSDMIWSVYKHRQDKDKTWAWDEYYNQRDELFPSYSEWRDLKDALYPGIDDMWDEYYSLPEGSQERRDYWAANEETFRGYQKLRDAFYEDHPEMKGYSEWSNAWFEPGGKLFGYDFWLQEEFNKYPWLEQLEYNKVLRFDEKAPPAPPIPIKELPFPIYSALFGYFNGIEKLEVGHEMWLRDKWIEQGMPYGNFWIWLKFFAPEMLQ